MKTSNKIALCFTVFITMLSSCGMDEKSIEEVKKFEPSKEFVESIGSNHEKVNTHVPSQFYKIDPTQDNVVEGENGTLLVIPEGSFLDANGERITSGIEVQLSEALSLDKMILSDLSTTSDGALLETDGMIYINVTSEGRPVTIDPKRPIHIEIPTDEKQPGMQVYTGERDSLGNMNWTDPQEIESYLVNVDMDLLDFLPNGFEDEVLAGLPYKGHTELSDELVDSLYYSLSREYSYDFAMEELDQIDVIPNEPFHGSTTHSNEHSSKHSSNVISVQEESHVDSVKTPKGPAIDPAIIKVIRTDEYQNTFIATREFEQRLQSIFRTCNNKVIEAYVKGIDQDMFKADKKVQQLLKGTEFEKEFELYAQEKLGNVKSDDLYLKLLNKHYSQRLKQTKDELLAIQKEADKILEKENKKTQKLISKYKKLLNKREKYRRKAYGFKWKKQGWINIDLGVDKKDFIKVTMDVLVENGADFERVHAYIIYKKHKSIHRMNQTDLSHHQIGNVVARWILLPGREPATLMVIGYDKEDKPSWSVQEFSSGNEISLSTVLEKTDSESLSKAIAKYNNKYLKENRIEEDLKFMKELHKEKNRQEALAEERIFISRLRNKAFPCLDSLSSYE